MKPPVCETELNDLQLLRDYSERKSDEAFARLVSRYINLVYSVALRKTGNAHDAEEITQAVFVVLARKAKTLRAPSLSTWLYQTARLTAANHLRTELRRTHREQESYMQSLPEETEPDAWPQIAPVLEDAMGRLEKKERDAIVLRFFDDKSLGEVGTALGVSADAAKMRINRAVEKLRRIFMKRGIALSGLAITTAVSAHAVESAPAGLAVATAATSAKGLVAASTMSLAEGTLKHMFWLKLKAAAIGMVLLATAGVTTGIIASAHHRAGAGSAGAVSSDTLIVPRTGVGRVRSDMTWQQVIAELGEPDRRTGRILHYVRQGFSVIPNPDNDNLRAVFCGSSLAVDGPMVKAFKGRTKEGIGMGSTRDEVLKAFGEPTGRTVTPPDRETFRYEPLKLSVSLHRGAVVSMVVDF